MQRGEGRRGECSTGNYSEGPNWSWSPTFAALPAGTCMVHSCGLGICKEQCALKSHFLNEILFLITVRIFFVRMNLYTLDDVKFKCNNNFQNTFLMHSQKCLSDSDISAGSGSFFND